MASFKFNSESEMMNFLLSNTTTLNGSPASVFDNWEVTNCVISAPLGLELSLNTSIIDSYGNSDYMIWKKIKNLVSMFWTDNNLTKADIDIRMLCPQDIKTSIDPDNSFIKFTLNFFSGSDVVVLTSTELEKSFPIRYDVVEAWTNMVSNYIGDWRKQYNSQQYQ